MVRVPSIRAQSVMLRFLWTALTLTLAACATISVQTNYDKKIDFARYRIFGWIGARDKEKPPPEWLDRLVRETIEKSLLAKGYQKASGKEPDFWIAYDAALEERTVWQPVFSGGNTPLSGTPVINPSSPVWIPFFSGAGAMTVCPNTIREGTLFIDFVDAKLNQPVWRSCAVVVVSDRRDAQRKIPRAVKKVLHEFPPD